MFLVATFSYLEFIPELKPTGVVKLFLLLQFKL